MERSRPSQKDINVAIVAHPANPPGPSGGVEMFSGILANSLVDQGPFNVRVYGHRGPTYPFKPEVTYVEAGPSAAEIQKKNNLDFATSVRRSIISFPQLLIRDITESMREEEGKSWVIIDNDITSAAIAPFLEMEGVHQIFIQHEFMAQNRFDIYEQARRSGASVVAIADHQRREVERRFGVIHDATIKNGIPANGTFELRPKPSLGEGIRIGTLSRIEESDEKGVRFALEAVNMLQDWGHGAKLSIAGKINDRSFYDQVIAPHIGHTANYVGMLSGQDKSDYLNSLHVGAALSNPGNYDPIRNRFAGVFEEGYSLAPPEMMLHGIIPVSTDSGGAEAMVDAKLSKFIVPLKVLEEKGHDIFIARVASTMLDAVSPPLTRHDISSRVRTAEDMGAEYAEYIMRLVDPKTVFTAPGRTVAKRNNITPLYT